MTCTLVCSCGLYIRTEHGAILIDAPNEDFPPFASFPESEISRIIRSEPPYDLPLCICYTHRHPDHYSAERLHRILDARPNTEVILPSEASKELLLFDGSVQLESHPIAHTPVKGYDDVLHSAYFISADKSLYITADAACDIARHHAILAGRQADAAFWNGQYLSHPKTRQLMLLAAKKNYIYHIPALEPDPSGIRRKALHNLERFGSELPGLTLLLSYPETVL